MGKLSLIITALLLSVCSVMAADPAGYEWWFDNDVSTMQSGTIPGEQLNIPIDVSTLPQGTHYFNCRLKTDDSKWGSVYRKMFLTIDNSSRAEAYEYWLDNDYANRKSGSITDNSVNFEVDLNGFDKSREAHYFNLRMRDNDGDWGSVYRKLIIFYDNTVKVPLIGYRHSVNGINLGYVKIPGKITDSYTFDVDLSDTLDFNIKDKELKFEGDKVSIGGNDSIHYCLQIESEFGFSPPQTWNFEVSHAFSTTAVAMGVNTSRTFTNPLSGEFVAVKFNVADKPLYVRADSPVTLDIYRDGSKVKALTGEEVASMAMLELEAGEYYGILYGPQSPSGEFTFHLTDTGNVVPTPVINFNDGIVTMICNREDASIYYTLDDSKPVPDNEGTILYIEPFLLDKNATIKAIAAVVGSDIERSDIAELVINSYMVADPVIVFENLMVIITPDEREGVRTYYTIDGNEPTEDSEVYGAPFSLTGNTKVLVRSFKEGYNPSNIVEYNHSHTVYVTGAPEIKVEGTTVTLTATTEGSTLYYSIDDPNPTREYTAPFEMAVNGTVYAQARKSGMYDSEVVSLEVRSLKTDAPYGSFDAETRLLTLYCDTEGAVISYSANNNVDWTIYEEPILIEGNITIYAKAEAPDHLESEVVEIVVSEFKCEEVTITYDGRFVTITTEEPDAEIRYTLDGGNPTVGEVYTGKFDAMDICVVKAVAVKDGYMNSDIAVYSIEVYADEEHAKTIREGVLETGYGWASNEVLDNVETYSVEGYMNEDDYSLIRSMRSLRHLDMEKVATELIPDSAFVDMHLVTVNLPEKISGYGEHIFMNNRALCALLWNSADLIVDNRLIDGVDNPNLLLYVNNKELDNSGVRNVVGSGKATSIVLTDGYPFHAPLEFEAESISYMRNFSKETAIGGCAGWETLILPFNVEEIRNSEGEIYPFTSSAETLRHFWLYSPIGTGWGKIDAIRANEPYLIAMPNNPQYVEEYNIAGDVSFSAANAVVEATPEPAGFGYKNGALMWGNYSQLESFEDLWVVNDESYEGNAPGSVFVKGIRDVKPFECYITSDSSRRSMPIFDSNEVETLLSRFGMKIWCENHELCIFSGIGQRVNIYDTVGQLVRVVDVTAEETCRVRDLAPGIYIVGTTKIMVK